MRRIIAGMSLERGLFPFFIGKRRRTKMFGLGEWYENQVGEDGVKAEQWAGDSVRKD